MESLKYSVHQLTFGQKADIQDYLGKFFVQTDYSPFHLVDHCAFHEQINGQLCQSQVRQKVGQGDILQIKWPWTFVGNGLLCQMNRRHIIMEEEKDIENNFVNQEEDYLFVPVKMQRSSSTIKETFQAAVVSHILPNLT